MLRGVLIAFGWIIPFAVVLLTATQIYSDSLYSAGGGQYAQSAWISVTRNICHGVQSLALSPLCFFGAYMLKERGKVSK